MAERHKNITTRRPTFETSRQINKERKKEEEKRKAYIEWERIKDGTRWKEKQEKCLYI